MVLPKKFVLLAIGYNDLHNEMTYSHMRLTAASKIRTFVVQGMHATNA